MGRIMDSFNNSLTEMHTTDEDKKLRSEADTEINELLKDVRGLYDAFKTWINAEYEGYIPYNMEKIYFNLDWAVHYLWKASNEI